MNNKYCKNCLRWYRGETDQCNIPDCGIPQSKNKDFNIAVGKINKRCDCKGLNFIDIHQNDKNRVLGSAHKIYGHPSLLNKNNDCYFYVALPKGLRWLTSLVRIFTTF